jgi:hypothetical protein
LLELFGAAGSNARLIGAMHVLPALNVARETSQAPLEKAVLLAPRNPDAVRSLGQLLLMQDAPAAEQKFLDEGRVYVVWDGLDGVHDRSQPRRRRWRSRHPGRRG